MPTDLHQTPANLTATCNSVCRTAPNPLTGGRAFSCPHSSEYNPVCWHQTLTEIGTPRKQMSFLNPCLAGCSGYEVIEGADGKKIEVSALASTPRPR